MKKSQPLENLDVAYYIYRIKGFKKNRDNENKIDMIYQKDKTYSFYKEETKELIKKLFFNNKQISHEKKLTQYIQEKSVLRLLNSLLVGKDIVCVSQIKSFQNDGEENKILGFSTMDNEGRVVAKEEKNLFYSQERNLVLDGEEYNDIV